MEANLGVDRAPARSSFAAGVREALGRDALLITSIAVFSTAFVVKLRGQVNQDAWLALVGGRSVAAHGAPHVETLTVWAHGATWVDQQWLGQLLLFRAFALGGLAAATLTHAFLTIVAYVVAVVAARRLGASSRAVLYTLPPCLWLLILGTWQLRTQSFSYLPFVLVLWLLARDGRRPDRRVFLVLPILALWTNLHGAVLLATALVVGYGAVALVETRRPLRSLGLIVLPPLMLLASPYGFDLVGYYRSTIFNSGFGVLVTEWQPTTLGLATVPFYALLIAAAVLIARKPRALTHFELGALALTGIAALLAERNIVWFAFAALVLVPRLVTTGRARSHSTLDASIALVAVATCLCAVIWTGTRPDTAFEATYPARAGEVTAAAAKASPTLRIYSDAHYADWLLWQHPELAGRVAFDIRFELLSPRQLLSISDFQEPTDAQWSTILRRYGLLVLDPYYDRFPIRSLARDPGAETIYRDSSVVVIRSR